MKSEYAEIGHQIDTASTFLELSAAERRLSAFIEAHSSPEAERLLVVAQSSQPGHIALRMSNEN